MWQPLPQPSDCSMSPPAWNNHDYTPDLPPGEWRRVAQNKIRRAPTLDTDARCQQDHRLQRPNIRAAFTPRWLCRALCKELPQPNSPIVWLRKLRHRG